MTPQLRFFPVPARDACPAHRIAYAEWGDPGNPHVLLCVHGLTRNGRDFDYLATALQSSWRILAPDMPGRGLSDNLPDPALYSNPLYAADLLALMDGLGVSRCDWVGTSMGGILGMIIAAYHPERINALVLNDVGALIPASGLERIASYAGKTMQFASRADAEAALRAAYAPFGLTEEAQWRHLFDISLREMPGGEVRLAYDPAIVKGLIDNENIQDIDLSELWNRITAPTLIIRGEHSDILPRAVVAAMQHDRPNVQSVEIPGAGHAPALMSAKEIAMVGDFLLHHR